MWSKSGQLATLAILIPLVACSQSSAQDAGASGDMRAKLSQVRSDAKTATMADLSDAHRSAVQAIVDKFDAGGSTLTLADATSQIDAILTPDESSKVLAERQKMRDAMHAIFVANGAQTGAASPDGPGAPAPNGTHRGDFAGDGRAPDAGRVLLQMDATPSVYRAAARAARQSAFSEC